MNKRMKATEENKIIILNNNKIGKARKNSCGKELLSPRHIFHSLRRSLLKTFNR